MGCLGRFLGHDRARSCISTLVGQTPVGTRDDMDALLAPREAHGEGQPRALNERNGASELATPRTVFSRSFLALQCESEGNASME